ncbi:MAG: lipocalin-like domain-containing protein [Thermodesulfobacteriota bacterium]
MTEEDRHFLTLFHGQRGWDREANTYERRDDGVHIEDSNDQWEWWYFDFSFGNGYKAAATLHYHNMMMLPHVPTMQLFIYPPDAPSKAKFWALRPGQENYAARDRCHVKMGNLSAEDTGDGYRLNLDMKDMGIDLTIRNVVPPWKAGSGVLWADSQTNLETGWIVAVPRGEVQGTLRVDGRTVDVEGLAYHDHNYGNGPMEKAFRGWYWGRLFDPTYTVVYGWVLPRDPSRPVVSPFMLAKDRKIVVSTDKMNLAVQESRVDDRYGFDMPMRLTIGCNGPGVRVDCQLVTKSVVETLALPRGNGFFHYYRFLAEYRALVRVDDKEDAVEGETFHEAMYLD